MQLTKEQRRALNTEQKRQQRARDGRLVAPTQQFMAELARYDLPLVQLLMAEYALKPANDGAPRRMRHCSWPTRREDSVRLRRTEPPALWTLLYRYIPVGLSKKKNQSVRSFIKTRGYKSQNPSDKDWHAWSSSLALLRIGPANSTTRREAPFALPWADWDDPGLSGYLNDASRTVERLDTGSDCLMIE